MFLNKLPVPVLLLTTAFAAIDIRRGGWLDRMVQYHKERFLNDVEEVAPVKINATIIPRPPGYKDSPQWDYESVMRLLTLIKESEAAAPVHRALRRMIRPSRRIMMGYKDSFQFFPRFPKDKLINMYYDTDSEEYSNEITRTPLEDGVIVVSNPVESRLPSAQISVKLLEEIMVARAIAARATPSTAKYIIPWTPMNKTTTSAKTTVTTVTPSNEEDKEAEAEEEAKEETEKEEGEGEKKGEEEGEEEAQEGAEEKAEEESENVAEKEEGEEKAEEEVKEEQEKEGEGEEEGEKGAEEGAEEKAEDKGEMEEGAEEKVEEEAGKEGGEEP